MTTREKSSNSSDTVFFHNETGFRKTLVGAKIEQKFVKQFGSIYYEKRNDQ